MLYSYTLVFTDPTDPYWLEELVNGDARSCGPWEICFPQRIANAKTLNDYANSEWAIPNLNGEEIFNNYDGIEISR